MGSAAGTQSGSRRLCLWSGLHLSRRPLLRCVQHHTIDGRLPCSQSSTRGCSLPRLCHPGGGVLCRASRRLSLSPHSTAFEAAPHAARQHDKPMLLHREHSTVSISTAARVSQERLAFKAVGVGLPRGALHSASQWGCGWLKNGTGCPHNCFNSPQRTLCGWQALNSTLSRRRGRLALSLLHTPSTDTCATRTQSCVAVASAQHTPGQRLW